MIKRGDPAWEVAYWFGVPETAILELLGAPDQPASMPVELPPPGPYPAVREAQEALLAIQSALQALNVVRRSAGLPEHKLLTSVDVTRPAPAPVPTGAPAPAHGTDAEEQPDGAPSELRHRKYKILQPKPAAPKPDSPKRDTPSPALKQGSRTLALHVRFTFEKGGFCRTSFLPGRQADLPDQIEISLDGTPHVLDALQDDWFDEIRPADVSNWLEQGASFTTKTSSSGEISWLLSGRDVYVLSAHPTVSGFINTPRLTIGAEHIVLCTADLCERVLDALKEAGAGEPAVLNEDFGMPAGWIALTKVIPANEVQPRGDGILDALRPRAEVEITFAGGVRIDRSIWLEKRPPRILVLGITDPTPSIDGRPAIREPDGTFTGPGWDLPGDHQVFCLGATRTYGIEQPAAEWTAWPAHSIAAANGILSICGPLVTWRSAQLDQQPVIVPASNPVLIGPEPGQIHFCARHGAGEYVLGQPAFDPAWALPAEPLQANRSTAFVRNIAAMPPKPWRSRQNLSRVGRSRVAAWSRAILLSVYKRLSLHQEDPATSDLWRRYADCARSVRRSLR